MILQDKWDYVSRNRKNGCKLTRTVDFQPLPYIFWKHLDENDGEGNGNPLQCSCLENPVDRGAWWAAIYGVAQSQTRLKWLSMHACIGEGNGNPIQNSCLENPRDSGAWWAAVYRVTHSRTRLKRLSSSNRWEWANCSVTDRQHMCRYTEAFSFPGDPTGPGKGLSYYSPWPSCLIHLSQCFSVQFSRSVVSDSLQPHGLQHARLACPLLSPEVCSNSCPLSQWCHPTISSSVVPFSSCLQSFPASGSFPVSQFFPSGGQSVGVSASASVLPMNIQDWFPLGLTGLISSVFGWYETFSMCSTRMIYMQLTCDLHIANQWILRIIHSLGSFLTH